jgi:hypothetical protein
MRLRCGRNCWLVSLVDFSSLDILVLRFSLAWVALCVGEGNALTLELVANTADFC